MTKIILSEFVKTHGQARAAYMLGVHQTAISQALRNSRSIYVSVDENGAVLAEEIKPFPNRKDGNDELSATLHTDA